MVSPAGGPGDPPLRRYGVLGCGAIGTTYGARLWAAGQPVRFCLRSDLEVGLARGLRLESPWGEVTVAPRDLCGSPAEIGVVEVLLVALKSTANARLASLLAAIQPSPAVIVLLQNGLGGEELVAAAAPEALVVGGVCDIACSRVGPAHVRHYAHGLVQLAPLQSTASGIAACGAVASDLVAAAVPVNTGLPLRGLRWRKLVWNMAFSGLCTVSGRRTQELLADPALRQRLLAVMEEVVAAAAADGADLEANVIDEYLSKTAAMPTYAPSMQLDAEAGRALELEAIYRIPLQRARYHGLAMPATTRLLQDLEALPAPGA